MTIKYAQIVNEITKQCNVGLGTDTKFYESLGFIKLNVEQSHDGNWYLEGYAPQKSSEEQLEELKLQKKEELKQARDNYLKLNHYDFSENDKFNIMNLLDNYTESDRTNYIEFLKNDLIPKYNNFSNQIKETTINNIEELRNLNFDFTEELE